MDSAVDLARKMMRLPSWSNERVDLQSITRGSYVWLPTHKEASAQAIRNSQSRQFSEVEFGVFDHPFIVFDIDYVSGRVTILCTTALTRSGLNSVGPPDPYGYLPLYPATVSEKVRQPRLYFENPNFDMKKNAWVKVFNPHRIHLRHPSKRPQQLQKQSYVDMVQVFSSHRVHFSYLRHPFRKGPQQLQKQSYVDMVLHMHKHDLLRYVGKYLNEDQRQKVRGLIWEQLPLCANCLKLPEFEVSNNNTPYRFLPPVTPSPSESTSSSAAVHTFGSPSNVAPRTHNHDTPPMDIQHGMCMQMVQEERKQGAAKSEEIGAAYERQLQGMGSQLEELHDRLREAKDEHRTRVMNLNRQHEQQLAAFQSELAQMDRLSKQQEEDIAWAQRDQSQLLRGSNLRAAGNKRRLEEVRGEADREVKRARRAYTQDRGLVGKLFVIAFMLAMAVVLLLLLLLQFYFA
ncbi:hypothetical protein NA57DRAFT_54441 [Rhizodiscina lignyota]|uniref:Uncharacterized protein n=1 Tax=Rhizodiscina lignyota TaxID=1504668 RepID=A0A9P4IG44_9PEZI|nr:hypothetical protein NA57DRAFT_54441 [Rhizodiscina lignyota]